MTALKKRHKRHGVPKRGESVALVALVALFSISCLYAGAGKRLTGKNVTSATSATRGDWE